MFAVSMPNFWTSAAFVETATKCFATAASSPNAFSSQARAVRAFVIVSIVVNVFDATMNSVSAGSRSAVFSTKSAPSTFETNRKVIVRSRVIPQRLVGHGRPQVGAADPNVHDGANALAREARPLPASHAVGERGHPIQHPVDVRHDVVPIDEDGCRPRRAQRDMKDRAILGDVDAIAAHHRVDSLAKAARPRRAQRADRASRP